MTAPQAMMSPAAPHHASGSGSAPSDAPEELSVETRFGPLTCSPQAVIDMPQGPLGFAGHRRFALLDLPNPRLTRFRLFQSMADPEVSFVVVPTDRESGGLLAPEDVDEACAGAGIAPADVVILLIVTVRQTPAGTTMTANLRAPVLLDVGRRTARQIVLPDPAYQIQHAL